MNSEKNDPEIDSTDLRLVLGQYPTGVAVITALSPEGEPVGMTVGSFTSVSMDPPLVAFLPDKSSSSWRAVKEAGPSFCVNFLSAKQEHVCRAVAERKTDKFADIPWRRSTTGLPVIEDCVAYLDCDGFQIFDAGDHQIVVGQVRCMNIESGDAPLLFFRGGYGSFRPRTLTAQGLPEDLLNQVDAARVEMELLATRLDVEVTLTTLHHGELVFVASAGNALKRKGPTRVGSRIAFAPPVGAVHAAFGSQAVRDAWLSASPDGPSEVEQYRDMLSEIRGRGYGFSLDFEPGVAVEPGRSAASSGVFNLHHLDPRVAYHFHSATAPVIVGGELMFTLTVWGPQRPLSGDEIQTFTDGLMRAADIVSTEIAGTTASQSS